MRFISSLSCCAVEQLANLQVALARGRLTRELAASQQLGLASLLQNETVAAAAALMPQLSMSASSELGGPGANRLLQPGAAALLAAAGGGQVASPAQLSSSSLGDMGAGASVALLQKLLASQLASAAQQQPSLWMPPNQTM